MLTWRFWTFWLVAFALLLLVIGTSQSFQECVGRKQNEASNQTLQQSAPNFFVVIGGMPECLGTFVEKNHTAVDALATILIAIFTGTLWWSTRHLWTVTKTAAEHIPRVERAYVFCGPDGETAAFNPDVVKFRLGLINAGKTPAIVKGVWGEFASQEPTGSSPRYRRGAESVNGAFLDLDMAMAASQTKILPELFKATNDENFFFGYLVYQDIFKNEHTSRFCSRINRTKKRFQRAGDPAWNEDD